MFYLSIEFRILVHEYKMVKFWHIFSECNKISLHF